MEFKYIKVISSSVDLTQFLQRPGDWCPHWESRPTGYSSWHKEWYLTVNMPDSSITILACWSGQNHWRWQSNEREWPWEIFPFSSRSMKSCDIRPYLSNLVKPPIYQYSSFLRWKVYTPPHETTLEEGCKTCSGWDTSCPPQKSGIEAPLLTRLVKAKRTELPDWVMWDPG